MIWSAGFSWAADRLNGGRGFGFTGGHFHKIWADDNFRRIVLNAAHRDATRRFGDHEFPKAMPLIVCCQNRAKNL